MSLEERIKDDGRDRSSPWYHYRVKYDYSHGNGAWFNFYGTNAEFVDALAAIFQEPFTIYNMKISGPPNQRKADNG